MCVIMECCRFLVSPNMAVMTDILSIDIYRNHIMVGIVSDSLLRNTAICKVVLRTTSPTHITVGIVSDSLVRNNCHMQDN